MNTHKKAFEYGRRCSRERKGKGYSNPFARYVELSASWEAGFDLESRLRADKIESRARKLARRNGYGVEAARMFMEGFRDAARGHNPQRYGPKLARPYLNGYRSAGKWYTIPADVAAILSELAELVEIPELDGPINVDCDVPVELNAAQISENEAQINVKVGGELRNRAIVKAPNGATAGQIFGLYGRDRLEELIKAAIESHNVAKRLEVGERPGTADIPERWAGKPGPHWWPKDTADLERQMWSELNTFNAHFPTDADGWKGCKQGFLGFFSPLVADHIPPDGSEELRRGWHWGWNRGAKLAERPDLERALPNAPGARLEMDGEKIPNQDWRIRKIEFQLPDDAAAELIEEPASDRPPIVELVFSGNRAGVSLGTDPGAELSAAEHERLWNEIAAELDGFEQCPGCGCTLPDHASHCQVASMGVPELREKLKRIRSSERREALAGLGLRDTCPSCGATEPGHTPDCITGGTDELFYHVHRARLANPDLREAGPGAAFCDGYRAFYEGDRTSGADRQVYPDHAEAMEAGFRYAAEQCAELSIKRRFRSMLEFSGEDPLIIFNGTDYRGALNFAGGKIYIEASPVDPEPQISAIWINGVEYKGTLELTKEEAIIHAQPVEPLKTAKTILKRGTVVQHKETGALAILANDAILTADWDFKLYTGAPPVGAVVDWSKVVVPITPPKTREEKERAWSAPATRLDIEVDRIDERHSRVVFKWNGVTDSESEPIEHPPGASSSEIIGHYRAGVLEHRRRVADRATLEAMPPAEPPAVPFVEGGGNAYPPSVAENDNPETIAAVSNLLNVPGNVPLEPNPEPPTIAGDGEERSAIRSPERAPELIVERTRIDELGQIYAREVIRQNRIPGDLYKWQVGFSTGFMAFHDNEPEKISGLISGEGASGFHSGFAYAAKLYSEKGAWWEKPAPGLESAESRSSAPEISLTLPAELATGESSTGSSSSGNARFEEMLGKLTNLERWDKERGEWVRSSPAEVAEAAGLEAPTSTPDELLDRFLEETSKIRNMFAAKLPMADSPERAEAVRKVEAYLKSNRGIVRVADEIRNGADVAEVLAGVLREVGVNVEPEAIRALKSWLESPAGEELRSAPWAPSTADEIPFPVPGVHTSDEPPAPELESADTNVGIRLKQYNKGEGGKPDRVVIELRALSEEDSGELRRFIQRAVTTGTARIGLPIAFKDPGRIELSSSPAEERGYLAEVLAGLPDGEAEISRLQARAAKRARDIGVAYGWDLEGPNTLRFEEGYLCFYEGKHRGTDLNDAWRMGWDRAELEAEQEGRWYAEGSATDAGDSRENDQ